MENSWAVPTHLLQSEGVANDLSDTIASDFPLESERKLDVFEHVATNWAVHTYDNSCSYNSPHVHHPIAFNVSQVVLRFRRVVANDFQRHKSAGVHRALMTAGQMDGKNVFVHSA
ncbi:hypothetical protein AVEN_110475-1 [Araneus ventricosus]|uniref:Uncharacterized protein n=1 Tax=Araneus ventricosus TaxID=182803 RepID=A0A4Y2SG07_ARAVE|nr:hypothetical protein AVEN_110475-1 [Araneus ventricosus]